MLTCWRPITCILLIVERNSQNDLKRNYLKNQRQFLAFLLHFWNLHEIFHIWKTRMSLMAEIFLKLLTRKYALTWMWKSSCFRTPFGSQGVHVSQTLLKCVQYHSYPNFWFIQYKLSWKTSLWIRIKILGLFVNTLKADHMYSPDSWEKFPQPFEKELS